MKSIEGKQMIWTLLLSLPDSFRDSVTLLGVRQSIKRLGYFSYVAWAGGRTCIQRLIFEITHPVVLILQ